MTLVGFKPQWYITQHVVFTTKPLALVESLAQLIHLNFFSLACIINIRKISTHKMTSVGFEPQW